MTRIVLLTPPWNYNDLKAKSKLRRTLQNLRLVSGIDPLGVLPSLGLLSIASVLREEGCNVFYFETYDKDFQQVIDELEVICPDIVGLYSTTCTWNKTKEFINLIKLKFPKIFIGLGGPHADVWKERCLLECKALDVVVIGRGEFVFREIVRHHREKKSLGDIRNCYLREGELIAFSGYEEQSPNNWENLPLPSWDLIDFNWYSPMLTRRDRAPFALLFTTFETGCLFKCDNCTLSNFSGGRFIRPLERVKREIDTLITKYGVKTIGFYDNTSIFDVSEEASLELCNWLISKKYDLRWCTNLLYYKFINRKLLSKMKEAGCWRIDCNIKSGVQKNLDKMYGRHVSLSMIKEKIKLISESGIESVGKFLIGHPGETYEEALETINFACQLDLDYAYFAKMPLFPGSRLFYQLLNSGRLNPDISTWNIYHRYFDINSLSNNQISKAINLGYVKFYFRPKFLLKKILKAKQCFYYVKEVLNLI